MKAHRSSPSELLLLLSGAASQLAHQEEVATKYTLPEEDESACRMELLRGVHSYT